MGTSSLRGFVCLSVCLSVCTRKLLFCLLRRSLRWMNSTKATHQLQQENKKNIGWLSWSLPHLKSNETQLNWIKRPSVEDNLQWKMTFVGRWPSVEDNFWWKTTFGGGWPLMEDTLQWKTTFNGRQPLVEDNFQWKTTFHFHGRLPFGGRQSLHTA